MAQVPWLFSKHPETDFSRKRRLDFQSLIHFCIYMEAGTIRHELLKYFAYNSGTLSNSAFHQQRNKLLPETFPFLFRQFNDHYPFSLYKEKYQLLACDGSSFTFTRNPKDKDSYFAPDGKTTNGYNKMVSKDTKSKIMKMMKYYVYARNYVLASLSQSKKCCRAIHFIKRLSNR